MLNPDEIVCDPALRKQIYEYHPDVQDQVKMAYLLKGPTKQIVNFPKTGTGSRGFSKGWYDKYDWIEYSESHNKAYCFYCFRFKPLGSAHHFGNEVFTKMGFNDWRHGYKALPDHIGGVNSDHNKARLNCDAFRNERQSVSSNLARASKESEELYKIRLTSSLHCARFLIGQGLAFRGHNESLSSLNKGNFKEMVHWIKGKDEEVKNAYEHGGNMDEQIPVCGRSRLDGFFLLPCIAPRLRQIPGSASAQTHTNVLYKLIKICRIAAVFWAEPKLKKVWL
jgi:hypothetical protein